MMLFKHYRLKPGFWVYAGINFLIRLTSQKFISDKYISHIHFIFFMLLLLMNRQ